MSTIEFAKEMCRAGFDGSDLSGAEILETAERYGLVKAVAYDPAKHFNVTGSEYLDPGDRIYIFTDALAGARCGCRGADDMCPCQNVPDATTRRERAGA